jgi:Xaa-Pro aminopeptidase
MLTAEGCQRRIARLWEKLPDKVDWILLSDPRHVTYFSAFSVNPVSSSHGERVFLYVERGGNSILFCDNLTLGAAASDFFVDDVMAEKWYDHRHSVRNRDHVLHEGLRSLSKKVIGRIGLVESEWFPVGMVAAVWGSNPPEAADLPSLGDVIRDLRRRKDADEVELLRICMRAGEAGQAKAREVVRPGISEFDLYRAVHSAALQSLGTPGLVYGDFRATNASFPDQGGLPTDYVLQDGDLFILDFTVMLSGYRSDFTNTLAVGTPSVQQRGLFELCEQSLALGEQELKPGALGRDIHRAIASPFVAIGKPELFPYHAGHGLGLGHPEPPVFGPDSEDALYAGDVVALEPGAYEKGIGGVRIEHNYLITDGGYLRLTNHTLALE